MLHSAAAVVRTGSGGKFQARQLHSTLYLSHNTLLNRHTMIWFFKMFWSVSFIPLGECKCYSKAETYTQRTRAHMHSIRCSSFIKAHGVFWWMPIGWGLRYAAIRRILCGQSEAGCFSFPLLSTLRVSAMKWVWLDPFFATLCPQQWSEVCGHHHKTPYASVLKSIYIGDLIQTDLYSYS